MKGNDQNVVLSYSLAINCLFVVLQAFSFFFCGGSFLGSGILDHMWIFCFILFLRLLFFSRFSLQGHSFSSSDNSCSNHDHELKWNPKQRVLLDSNSDLQLYGWCDSERTTFPLNHRSLNERIISLGHYAISWKTKEQQKVAHSPNEVDYR